MKTAFQFTIAGALAGSVLLAACSRTPQPPAVRADSLDTSSQLQLQLARNEVLRHPRSAETWGRLGQLLDAAQFSPAACECYGRAAELDANTARWFHLLGLLQLQNEPDAAISNLTRAAAVAGPTNDAPAVRLIQALVEHGRLAEATRQIETLLRSRPEHPAARLELARVRLAENQLAGIERILEPALTNAFTARPALFLLSQIQARKGESAQAAALAERAANMPRPFDWPDPFLREVQSLRPRRTELADAAGSLLARGRTAEAEKVIDELRRQFPQDAEALLLQGRLLLMQQNFAGAEAAFRRHLELNENSVNGLFQLSLALLRQQKWDEAARALDRAVSLKPDFAQAHANLALAKSRSGDAKGAVESYRNAIRCRPGDAATRAALAEELARAGRTAEAREEVELALKIEPKLERAQKLRDALLRP